MRRSLAMVAIMAGATQLLSGCVVAGGYSSNDGGSGFFFLLPLLMFVFIAYAITRMGRQRGRSGSAGRREEPANPQMTRAELSVLADDVLRLEPQIALHPEAREDFDAATHRYRVAQAAIEHAQSSDDLIRVRRVVDEATWSMSRARAVIEGRPPPAPPPQLQRPGPRGEPAVGLDDRDAPTYVGSPAPFRSGWFGGGGLLGGMFFGPLIGGFGGWVLEGDEDDEDGEYDDGPQ